MKGPCSRMWNRLFGHQWVYHFLSNKITGPRGFVTGAFELSPFKFHFLVSLFCHRKFRIMFTSWNHVSSMS